MTAEAAQQVVMRTLIVGYGNPLRGDDGVSWRAIEELQRDGVVPEAELIVCHQLTIELSEPISRAERVIFIDASTGPVPGQIQSHHIAPRPATTAAFSHSCDPATLLAFARLLYGRGPREAVMLSIVGASFDYGEQLSGPVAASLPALVERARELNGR